MRITRRTKPPPQLDGSLRMVCGAARAARDVITIDARPTKFDLVSHQGSPRDEVIEEQALLRAA